MHEFWDGWPENLRLDNEETGKPDYVLCNLQELVDGDQLPPHLLLTLGDRDFEIGWTQVLGGLQAIGRNVDGNEVEWCLPLLTENPNGNTILGYVGILAFVVVVVLVFFHDVVIPFSLTPVMFGQRLLVHTVRDRVRYRP